MGSLPTGISAHAVTTNREGSSRSAGRARARRHVSRALGAGGFWKRTPAEEWVSGRLHCSIGQERVSAIATCLNYTRRLPCAELWRHLR